MRIAKLVFGIGLGLAASLANAGVITSVITNDGPFTDDASSGIGTTPANSGPGITYGPSNVVVNGVTFTGSNGAQSGTLPGGVTWALAGLPNQFGGYSPPGVSGNVANLGNNFFFDGGGTETLTLGNLTPGQQYVLSQYNFAFGSPGGRVENISDSLGGSLSGYDENATPGSITRDTFTADNTASITVSYTLGAGNGGDSFHQYDFQLSAVPEPASISMLGLGVIGLLSRRRHA